MAEHYDPALMAYLALFIAIVALGAVGWWRGGIRMGLGILPLLLASVLMWLLGGMVYGWTVRSHSGLLWPGLVLLASGLIVGYAVQFAVRRAIKNKPVPTWDHIAGSVVGVIMAVVLVWVGSVYFAIKAASEHRAAGSSEDVARMLNAGVVQWIPGLGAGSSALMSLKDIATASDAVRERVARDMGLDKLSETPAMQAVLRDEQTIGDVEALGGGDITAVLRLQSNPLIIELFDSPDIKEILGRVSLAQIAEAVRRAQEEEAEARHSDG